MNFVCFFELGSANCVCKYVSRGESQLLRGISRLVEESGVFE